MNKRIVIKTAAICFGLFITLISAILFYFSNKYELDTEPRVGVVVASTGIEPGTVVDDSRIGYKTIRISALTDHMIQDINKVQGQKAIESIGSGDYVRSYNLLSKESWHKDDEREVVLPMDYETRLANLIKRGSLVDILVDLNNTRAKPRVVLSRVRVEGIIDDTGVVADDTLGSRKAYAKFVLDKKSREKIYVAQELGKLKFELYCDSTQPAAPEEFEIPSEYLK